MSLEDVFAGISFADAKISTSGAVPTDGGNAGTPPPAQGQPGATPTPPATQDAGKSPAVQGAQPSDKPGEKPLPYDQDPKWKKARATEAAVDKLLQEHGILNLEELGQKLADGMSIKKLLGERDAKKLIEDAEYANRVRQNWDEQKRAKQYEGETPEARAERLERENQELRDAHENFKSTVESREHAQKVIQGFNTEVDKVISSVETPLPEHELGLLKLVLGVENPANMIDIEDQMAVRKMAREGITNFQTLVQKIKQSAINDYVAGKSKLAVDTTQQGAPVSPGQGAQRTPLPKDASVDQVFGQAKNEFLEILLKGAEAAH
jgi:exonuclease VII small subunit